MFFWIILTCHAEWSDCTQSPQPNLGLCIAQATAINQTSDAIALCTSLSADRIIAPEAWTFEGANHD